MKSLNKIEKKSIIFLKKGEDTYGNLYKLFWKL